MTDSEKHIQELRKLQCQYGRCCKFWETGEDHTRCEPKEGLREMWQEPEDPCKCGDIMYIGYWDNHMLWKEILHTRDSCELADVPDRDWKWLVKLAARTK